MPVRALGAFYASVSGVTTKLSDRQEGRRLFDLLRAGDTLVVRWVDRLGRNYEDVSDNIRGFMRRGVVIRTIINGMTFDGATKDPMQQAVRDALIGFMAALSQAQAEATKEAQRAGIAHAKAGAKRVYLGRKPSYTKSQVFEVVALIEEGRGGASLKSQRTWGCPARRFTGFKRALVTHFPPSGLGRDSFLFPKEQKAKVGRLIAVVTMLQKIVKKLSTKV